MKSSVLKPAGILVRALDAATRLSLLLSGVALLLLLLSYSYEVLMRYFFGAPTLWTYDMSTWFLCLLIMLALPAITREKGNIAITFLIEKFNAVHQRRIEQILAAVSGLICLLCAWFFLEETMRQYHQGIETLWNYPIPKWLVSAVIPFGLCLSGLHFLRICIIRNPEVGMEVE